MYRKNLIRLLALPTVFALVATLLVGNTHVAQASTNVAAFTNNGASANTAVRRNDTNVLVMDVTLPMTDSDTVIDVDGVYGVTFGSDTNVSEWTALNGDSLINFTATSNVYWYDADSSSAYNSGDLIWLSQGAENTTYDPINDGDQAIVGGPVSGPVTGVELTAASYALIKYNDADASTTYTIGEDIFLDNGHTLGQLDADGLGGLDDDLIDADGGATVTDTTAGSATVTAGTALTNFVVGDSVKLYWYDASGGFTAWNSSTDLIWWEKGGDGDFDPNGDGDVAIAGRNIEDDTIIDDAKTEQLVAAGPGNGQMAYYDETVGGGFSLGTDEIIFEASTYPTGRLYNADALTAITLENTGTAIQDLASTQDISAVKVWLDDGDGVFSATADTNLGTASRVTNSTWQLSGLTQAITATSKRIFATVDILSGATNGRTCIFKIPQIIDDTNVGGVGGDGGWNTDDVGVYFGSTNDGPADASITNAYTQTILVTAQSSPDATVFTAPTAPATVWTHNAINTALTINWAGASRADNYTLYRRTNPTDISTEVVIISGYRNTSYTDVGLSSGTTYYYAVKSNSDNGLSSGKSVFIGGTTTGTAAPVVPPSTPPVAPGPDSKLSIPANLPTKMPDARLFDYRAQWVSQNGTISNDGRAHEVSGTPGQIIDLDLTLKNVGKAVWKSDWTDAAQWIKLGTWRPQDGLSPLYYSSWLSGNRIAVSDLTVNQNDSYTFHFKVQIPATATVGTHYKFYVRPVAEWVEWFGPTGIFWDIIVS